MRHTLASDMEMKKREQGRQEMKKLKHVSITLATHVHRGSAMCSGESQTEGKQTEDTCRVTVQFGRLVLV